MLLSEMKKKYSVFDWSLANKGKAVNNFNRCHFTNDLGYLTNVRPALSKFVASE